jgi:large subunit ribosomal protein L25
MSTVPRRNRLLRDSQMHPYKPLVLHVDFLRVDATHAIHQKVPLHFVNADIAVGVKIDGGVVSHAMNEVDVACLPQDLPAFIEVDLKDLEGRPDAARFATRLPGKASSRSCMVTTTRSWRGHHGQEGGAAAEGEEAAPAP